MPQETPERLVLAASIITDAQAVPQFTANQGFASVQAVANNGGSDTALIYRPASLPATPENMVAYMPPVIGALVVPAFPTTIVGPAGLAGPIWQAAVIAAAQPGDVVGYVPFEPLVEGVAYGLLVFQITPAD